MQQAVGMDESGPLAAVPKLIGKGTTMQCRHGAPPAGPGPPRSAVWCDAALAAARAAAAALY
eukprot:scaffold215031_cov21-Tisochrysis_lutea.AAC.1